MKPKNVNRNSFLANLQALQPGLAVRESTTDSQCFAFTQGMVMAFNDEIACRAPSPLNGVKGTVQARPLLNLLNKLPEDTIKIWEEGDKLYLQGEKKLFWFAMKEKIALPIDAVETPDKWKKLPKRFNEALGVVKDCASKDNSKFNITCLHLHPEFLEAMDNVQIVRYAIKTGMDSSALVRRESIQHIIELDMEEFCDTKSWIHFKNGSGLIFSCRRYAVEDYPKLDPYLKPLDEKRKIVFPKNLIQTTERIEEFSGESKDENHVLVEVVKNAVRITGEASYGGGEEVKKVEYKGPPVSFRIPPGVLRELCKKNTPCDLMEGKMLINGGRWTYVSCLGPVKKRSK